MNSANDISSPGPAAQQFQLKRLRFHCKWNDSRIIFFFSNSLKKSNLLNIAQHCSSVSTSCSNRFCNSGVIIQPFWNYKRQGTAWSFQLAPILHGPLSVPTVQEFSIELKRRLRSAHRVPLQSFPFAQKFSISCRSLLCPHFSPTVVSRLKQYCIASSLFSGQTARRIVLTRMSTLYNCPINLDKDRTMPYCRQPP